MSSSTPVPNQLIEDCQGLVRSLALKVHRNLPPHVELDDLIGYGQIGLAEAARDFESERGMQFTTFAYYRIRGAIYDGISKMSWVKRSQYQRIKYEQMAGDVLRVEGETDPAAPAPAAEDARWFKNVASALAVVYLSSRLTGEEGAEALDIEDQSPPPETAVIDQEVREKLHQLIDELPDDSRTLIKSAYFEGQTLTEAGQRLGIGKAWASRLHSKTLDRLARALRLAGISE
jgi:RNA polymerase sigma factor for flagellar operon FliA